MALVFPSIDITDEVRGTVFNYKASVVVSSTPNSNWTTSASLAFVAPTLTITGLTAGGARGLLDSVEPADADRVLIKDAGAAIAGAAADDGFNGVWIVTGGSTTSITLVRSYDMQVGDNALGASVWIDTGTVEALRAYVCTSNVAITDAATNSVVFARYDVRGFTADPANLVTSTAVGADDRLARYDGAARVIQSSGVSLSDTDSMTGLVNVGMSGDILDANGNEILILESVASAVNEITVTNAATGVAPIISTTGEANVGMEFNTAGTGVFVFAATGATTSGELRLEDNTGGQYVGLAAPTTIATSFTLNLPVDFGSAGQALTTDGNNPAALAWSNVATARRDYVWQSNQITANVTTATEVAWFAWDLSDHSTFTTNTIKYYHVVGATRNLTVQVYDTTNATSLGTDTITAATADGIATFTFTDPASDARISLRVSKNTSGGVNPEIFGVEMQLT